MVTASAPDDKVGSGPAEQITEVARKLLVTLSRQEIPMTPENYRVWFEYTIGSTPAMNMAAIDTVPAATA